MNTLQRLGLAASVGIASLVSGCDSRISVSTVFLEPKPEEVCAREGALTYTVTQEAHVKKIFVQGYPNFVLGDKFLRAIERDYQCSPRVALGYNPVDGRVIDANGDVRHLNANEGVNPQTGEIYRIRTVY